MRVDRNVLIAAVLTAVGPLAYAQTTKSQVFQPSATVESSCTFAAGGAPSDLNFGIYDPLAASSTDAAGSTIVACTNGTPLFVYISTPGARRMTGPGSATLPYEIYLDANRTVVFPSSRPSSANYTGTGASQTIVYYGRIAAGSPGTAGSYTQTATFNVEF